MLRARRFAAGPNWLARQGVRAGFLPALAIPRYQTKIYGVTAQWRRQSMGIQTRHTRALLIGGRTEDGLQSDSGRSAGGVGLASP